VTFARDESSRNRERVRPARGHCVRARHAAVWDGVLHVVPPPSFQHQLFGTHHLKVLERVAQRHGFHATYGTGVFDVVKGDLNFRVPDLVVVDPKFVSKRGVDGRLELAVENLSPNDESRQKFELYAMC
jgi:putative restriction endonuclease